MGAGIAMHEPSRDRAAPCRSRRRRADPPSRAQVNGGKWIVRLKKGVAARYWEDVILAIVGGQFNVGDEICGAVLSVRYNEDIISLWNKSAESRKLCMQIRETLRTVMGLPADAVMEYKKHRVDARQLVVPQHQLELLARPRHASC